MDRLGQRMRTGIKLSLIHICVALVEGRRIGGVEVLGHRIAHGASAEAQHVSVRVDDGEHGAVSEHGESASLATEHQAGLNELLRGEALLHQPPADLRRGRGGADAETADDRIRQPALLKVCLLYTSC